MCVLYLIIKQEGNGKNSPFDSVISVIVGAENLCSFFAVSDYEPGVFTNDFTRINIF